MRLGVNGRFYGARPTGVQRFAREVVRRLARQARLTVFLPRGVAPPGDLPGDTAVVRGRLPGKVWEQLELPRRAAEVDVVLHPANVAPLLGPPGVLVLHDVLPLSHPRGFGARYRAWARVAGRAGARRSRAVITVSRWSASEIVRLLHVPEDRITVVTQGTSPFDAPAPAAQVAEVLARHRVTPPYFLCLAGRDPRKGLDLLRAVWDRIPPSPGVALAVVGGGDSAVHPRVAGGGDGRIRLLGHVSDGDLWALYTGATALLFPSSAEGFGRPPLEAMACGTRVVAAPYGPVREVVGRVADVVPLEPTAWVDAVVGVLTEAPSARARRVEEGHRHARGFSWDEAAEAVARVCRQVAGGAR